MWDILRSLFIWLPEPQHLQVVARAVQRHSGWVLCLDHQLLTSLLYGNNMAQAQNDDLLMCLANLTIGTLQA